MRFKGLAAALALSVFVTCLGGPATLGSSYVQAAKKTSYSISKKKATLYVGKSLTLKVNGVKKGSGVTVKWSTSKKTVAAVSSKGKVKAKKAGSAVITATVIKNKKALKKLTCKITVKKAASGSVALDPKTPKEKAKRTVIMFTAGADLEENDGALSKNFENIMSADIPEDVNFLAMTGGTSRYFLDKKYCYDKNGKNIAIDVNEKQIWSFGGNGTSGEGRMTLVKNMGEYSRSGYLSADVLREYIDYCAKYYPAEKYDLILWSHGFGIYGFGASTQEKYDELELDEIISAVKGSTVKKFDMMDFDCCVMGNIETLMALYDLADAFVVSADAEPAAGQIYKNWLTGLEKDPLADGYTIGKTIVDDYNDYYNFQIDPLTKKGLETTLAVVRSQDFIEKIVPELADLTAILLDEAKNQGGNKRYNFYDELHSVDHSVQYTNSGVSTVDLGNLADALGVCITESDNLSAADESTLSNRYTKASAAIKKILSDNGLFYSKSSDLHTHSMTGFGRNAAGEVTVADKVKPSGISITFPFASTYTTAEYAQAADQVRAKYENKSTEFDKDAVELIDNLKQIQEIYTLIISAGKASSNLANEGKTGITYAQVLEAMYTDITYDKSWLTDIIGQQLGELVSKDNFKVTAGQDKFDYTLENTSFRVLSFDNALKYQETIKAADSKDGAGSDVVIKSAYAEVSPKLLDQSAANAVYKRRDLYKKNEVTFTAEAFDKKWYALKDAAGKTHLVQLEKSASSDELYEVPLRCDSLSVSYDGKETFPGSTNIRLTVKQESDGTVSIIKVEKLTWGGDVDFPDYDKYTIYNEMYTASGPQFYLDLTKINANSPVAYDLSKKNLGFSMVSGVDISTVDNVTEDMFGSVGRKCFVKDIYGIVHSVL